MERDDTYLIGNKFAQGNKPNKTAFKKGSIPWNRGKKGLHLSPKSEFKKGQKSINWVPVFTIKKRGDGRNYIKISEPNKWEELAKYIWKKKYGKLFKGDFVHHIDGSKDNDSKENLIAIPRFDHPIFHSRWGLKQFSEEQIIFYKKRYE